MTMKRRMIHLYPGPGIRIIVGFILFAGICCAITTGSLQPADSCPEDLAEEEYFDELEYDAADAANASALSDELSAKYCEWAVEGNCYLYDAEECSRYGVFFPGTYLTSDIAYVLKDTKPGILVLFGAWTQVGNSTKPVRDTDINVRIYQKDPFNVRIHKTFNTGDDGQALFEWIWGDTRSDWEKDWVLEYSYENFTGKKSLYSGIEDTRNFTEETLILEKYPDTILY
jgi:hypothetical protein